MVLDEPFDQAIGIAAAPLIQISSDISKKRAVLRYKDWIGSKIGHLIFVRPRYSPADRPRPKPLSVPNALLRLMFFSAASSPSTVRWPSPGQSGRGTNLTAPHVAGAEE